MNFDAETDDGEIAAFGRTRFDQTSPVPTPAAGAKLPILVLMHGEASSAGRIGQWLTGQGYNLDIRKPRFGCCLPATLERHSGLVVFGGPMSCNDTDEYLAREIDFLGVALKEEKPFLGICLGAQMLAKHLGAKVAKDPGDKVEIGYHPVTPTPSGRRLGPWPSFVYHWHREGFDLPAGATRLAEGAVFENQAMTYGKAAVGLQFHPEITYSLINRWTTMAKDWRGALGAQPREGQLAGHLLNAPVVAAWLDRLLGVWIGARVSAA